MATTPVFMGFRPKEPWGPHREWRTRGARQVEYVCSVSDCLCEPVDQLDLWAFNRAHCYASEAEALAAVPSDLRANFVMFAYWLVPVRYGVRRELLPVQVDEHFPLDGEPLPAEPSELRGYSFIGYDVVATQGPKSHGFECSPLSCNTMSNRVAVNRYCLIDELEVALEAARVWTCGELPPDEQPATGNYVVVRVAMKSYWQQLIDALRTFATRTGPG